jgi:arylsulfatase A-like enzyme
MPPYLYVENDRAVEQATEYVEAGAHRREGGGGFWRGGLAASNFRHMEVLPRITEKAVAYIEAQADRQMTPFFLYLALTAPHTPWLPLERFRNRSKAGYYGDFCVQVDDTVGAIVQALNRSGLSDRTLLIFTSDNGAHWPQPDIARYGHRANLHFRGQKADIWEGGHRIPLILRWPGKIAEGSHSSRLVSLTDLYATFAALVGTTLEDNEAEDSFNILPNLIRDSGDSPIRDAMVQHSKDGMFAIRKGDWKLIQGLGSGGFTEPAKIEPGPGEMEGQLYNMAEDPAEQHNLYQSEPKRVESLSALLKAYQESGRTRESAYPSP